MFVQKYCECAKTVMEVGKGGRKKRSTYARNRQTHENRYMNSLAIPPTAKSLFFLLFSLIFYYFVLVQVAGALVKMKLLYIAY